MSKQLNLLSMTLQLSLRTHSDQRPQMAGIHTPQPHTLVQSSLSLTNRSLQITSIRVSKAPIATQNNNSNRCLGPARPSHLTSPCSPTVATSPRSKQEEAPLSQATNQLSHPRPPSLRVDLPHSNEPSNKKQSVRSMQVTGLHQVLRMITHFSHR